MTHRVLVCDDDPVTAKFVASLMRREGHEVLVAEDGQEAVDLARCHRPHLMICDLVMPYRDGFSVLRSVRADRDLWDIPVILLSMRDREEDIVRGFEEGADDYVVKPFKARELIWRVRRRLYRARVAS